MADDTPDTPGNENGGDGNAPAPRRRAAPRKPAAKAPARKTKANGAASEGTVTRAASAAREAVTDAGERVARAVKPRSTKRSTTRAAPAARSTRATTA